MADKRILIADDEPFILRSLTYVLRRAGFEVLEARDGQEALDGILREQSDLVILDVMMPHRNGYEVAEAVKSDPALSGCRVVLLTARGQDSDRERGLALGVEAYLTKPFSPMKIVELAHEILDRVPSR